MTATSPIPPLALITGAAQRIGRTLALSLAEAGWDIAIHYGRSRGPALSLRDAITALGRRAEIFDTDLADEQATQGLMPRVNAALGTVGLLINNAAVFEMDQALTATADSWQRHMNINLRAPFVLSQELARQLPDNAQGLIINMLDQRVWNLTPYFMSYTVSKMGLWTLTRTLAQGLAPRIRVNAVGPGPCLPSPFQSQAEFDRQCQLMPLKRGTSPTEIAQAIAYVIAAPAMTGQMIALDGGQHLGWAQPTREYPID